MLDIHFRDPTGKITALEYINRTKINDKHFRFLLPNDVIIDTYVEDGGESFSTNGKISIKNNTAIISPK